MTLSPHPGQDFIRGGGLESVPRTRTVTLSCGLGITHNKAGLRHRRDTALLAPMTWAADDDDDDSIDWLVQAGYGAQDATYIIPLDP